MTIFTAIRLWIVTVLLAVGVLASFHHFNLPTFAFLMGLALVPWRALFGRRKAKEGACE